jgi:23S rRNA maturation mini-RNase III
MLAQLGHRALRVDGIGGARRNFSRQSITRAATDGASGDVPQQQEQQPQQPHQPRPARARRSNNKSSTTKGAAAAAAAIATATATDEQRERDTTLAFLGDAVWALHARARHLLPPRSAPLYRARATALQRAEAQAAACDALLRTSGGDDGAATLLLTPEESALLGRVCEDETVVPRGRFRRRATSTTGGKTADQSAADAQAAAADALAYRRATALEALVGHLQLTDPDRLLEVMSVALDAAEAAADAFATPAERKAKAVAAAGAAGRRREKQNETTTTTTTAGQEQDQAARDPVVKEG